jgi:hypothetical protein
LSEDVRATNPKIRKSQKASLIENTKNLFISLIIMRLTCRRTPSIKAKFEPWEDARLLEVVRTQDSTNWHEIAAYFPGRNARQCRERWSNYVNPTLLKGEWTETEDQILLQTYCEIGPKWFVIASFLPGRAKNSVKNRYFTLQRQMNVKIGRRSENLVPPPPASISIPIRIPAPVPMQPSEQAQTQAQVQAQVQTETETQINRDGNNNVFHWLNPLQSDPVFEWDVDQWDAFGYYL